jgi:uncharacterized membrane protein YdbT with pleckstrin-like domain
VIEITCDNCEEPFQVEVTQAGTKVPCPRCGDINRVPEALAGGDLPDQEGPEEAIIELRPVMFRARPLWYMLMVGCAVGGLAGAIWGMSTERDWAFWLGIVSLVAGGAWWLIWYVLHLGEHVQITNKRTIYRRGLVSRHTSEVLHDHIRNVQIRQTIWQRLTGVGDVALDSSAGGDMGAEIRVVNVPRPAQLKAVIDRYRSF